MCIVNNNEILISIEKLNILVNIVNLIDKNYSIHSLDNCVPSQLTIKANTTTDNNIHGISGMLIPSNMCT